LTSSTPGRPSSSKSCNRCRNCATSPTDQQNSGTTLTLNIDRDMASRYGIQPQLIDDTLYDAFGQRQVTQYFTQVNTYYVIEEVLPELLGDPATLDKIYIRSPDQQPDGARQRLR
jgi:multidrug efflux pump subunit AcrB